ncbi:carbamoyltransferase C-terminal domain-containing protein [Streptomyces sp. FXJ1.172]|uniref:carbamoyltransferase C-terminal domain-containing protein n=1 Tax=Streptomyces sp. FXJ1.172 TaxID=710705 RepID=UPI0007D04081|nr:carbamoyltransferase C-terminal domain-containing protein [Streptomyces sp. FXJ1.172]WEO95427.1 carbamoyltransferase C-terminal domain-containing protein [Streptomyces sp. FXJ1.172]
MALIAGYSEGFHDAALCLLDDTKIVHASHSERYSRVKGDRWLHRTQLDMMAKADTVAYYERPWLKATRRLYSGQKLARRRNSYDVSFAHHESHAAAGYYTAPFDDCNILVIDAIGEWDTISIWDNMKKVRSWRYPYSLGLLYSAITKRVGLKPNSDEYITMGMAAYGEPVHDLSPLLEENLHLGCDDLYPDARNEDLAASVQKLFEEKLLELVAMCPKENLVLMGGCALNCVANSRIQGKNIWIMPNPGDAGSALGAAALVRKAKLQWADPYLGTELPRANPSDIVRELLKNKVCGVASERAEFGPRALGNRSLLADCRYEVKDTVNKIKRRQLFRPFAPAILEEYAHKYFEGPMNEYMQFTSRALHDYSSVTHVDGTARVQVVKKNCSSVLRAVLEEWYEATGVPMLLNTSLNIKDEPMVDTAHDARMFTQKYGVNVY